MPLIKRPPVPPQKDTVALRLEVTLIEELKRYRSFIGGNYSHVVSQCLRRVFDKDGEYHDWLKTHDTLPPKARPTGNGHSQKAQDARGGQAGSGGLAAAGE